MNYELPHRGQIIEYDDLREIVVTEAALREAAGEMGGRGKGQSLDETLSPAPPSLQLQRGASYRLVENSVNEEEQEEAYLHRDSMFLEKKYIMVDGVLKIQERYRKELLGAVCPLPYRDQSLALLSTTDDMEAVDRLLLRTLDMNLQLSQTSKTALSFLQDSFYAHDIDLKEDDLGRNLDSLMTLCDQLDLPLGCLHKLQTLQEYNLHFLIDNCSEMLNYLPFSPLVIMPPRPLLLLLTLPLILF
jgi:hypothetical protein